MKLFKINSLIEEFELFIFNRWGELLYHTNDIDQGWDGTFGGQLAQDGIYTWTIFLNRTKGDQLEIITETGHVTVMR